VIQQLSISLQFNTCSGAPTIESTVPYLAIEVDDAIKIARRSTSDF
jgi:hypothetical protein